MNRKIGIGAALGNEEFSNKASLAMKGTMQTIYPTSLTPEQYVEQEFHKQVRPPENCPNCQRAHALEVLAYYHRYITTATELAFVNVQYYAVHFPR